MLLQFLLFQFYRIIVEAYYLQHFVTPTNSNDEGWLIKNPYNGAATHTYNCAGNTMLGGYQIFGCYLSTKTSMTKYFKLPPHYKVVIEINFWKIDNWPSTQYFYIFIDQWTQSWYFTSNTGLDQCGGPGTDYSTLFDNNFPQHTLGSIIVELYSDCDTDNFWGLTNFQITLYECYLGCQFCLDSTADCIMWNYWQSFFQLQNLDDGLEGWIQNKFPSFTQSTNDLQMKMLVLNQLNSAITYLTLPDHYSIIIQFRIEYLSTLPITVRVYINDEYKYGLISYKKQVDYRTSTIYDTRNAIKLEIYSLDGTVGIREVSIILRGPINLISCLDDNLVPFDGCFAKQESCQEGCVFCVRGECLMCDTKWDYNPVDKICEPSCGDKYLTAGEQCDDGNDLPFDGCHQCQFSCPFNCQNCLFGQCQTCNSGYYYSNRKCISNYDNLLISPISQVDYNQFSNYLQNTDMAVCGDGKVQEDEECDDGNNFPNDGCYHCYFSCILNCQQCSFGICQQCIPTYELINEKCNQIQTQFRSINCYIVNSIASDNFISEVGLFTCCDTFDTYFNDICHLERSRIKNDNQIIEFSCPLFCELCEYGKCKKCLPNHFLLKNQCKSEFRKGVLLFQDGISQQEIGCYQCNDSCQIQCLLCLNYYCLSCIDGWQHFNGKCIQICGDNQIAIWSEEQCDTNLDDCMNCKYVCPENCQFCIKPQECLVCDKSYIEINHKCQLACIQGCQKCINGICYNNCPNGEINVDGICYSICGDGIRQQTEQCDDGNILQFDGCFNCEYSCPHYCDNCLKGICFECQQYYKLIENQCYDDCGSGIKSQDEECDDGNLIDLDGCSSNCKIEVDFKCQEKLQYYSDCQYSESPYMLVKFLNHTYNKYYLEISFSQAIYFKDIYGLESLFDFSIDEIGNEDFQIKLESNYEPVINKIQNFQFQLQIEIISTNDSLVQFNVFLMNEAYNLDEMELLNPSEKILLKINLQMSQSDIEKTKQLTQYQEAMIMAQGIGSVIVLISGNFQIFVQILDTLQYQSYLKYINIIYPENLYLFFESTNLISIIPILDFLQIKGFYEKFLYFQFIESYAKLKYYNINAHLITNLEFFFIQVISTFIFVMTMKIISKSSLGLIYKIQTQHLLIFKLRSLKSTLLIKVLIWLYKFFHYILTFLYEFYQNGVEDLLLANAWDLLFKTFLCLVSFQRQDIISRVQKIVSYLALAASGIFITSSINRVFLRKEYKFNNNYRAVYLLKQFFFCYFLICLQNHQLIQILMLTTTNIIYVIALISINFNLKKLDKIQIIIMEISVITFTFSSIFYLKDYNYLISEQNQLLLGFGQIYLLISGLLGVFIKQVILIYQKIKQKWRKNKKRNRPFKVVTHLIFEVVQ